MIILVVDNVSLPIAKFERQPPNSDVFTGHPRTVFPAMGVRVLLLVCFLVRLDPRKKRQFAWHDSEGPLNVETKTSQLLVCYISLRNAKYQSAV